MENMTSYWDATTLAYVLEQEFDPAGQKFFNDFQHRALKEFKEIEFNRKRKKNHIILLDSIGQSSLQEWKYIFNHCWQSSADCSTVGVSRLVFCFAIIANYWYKI